MKKSLGFTLAEVLITLAIIGVVAAMTIPSIIANTNQSEFKTGIRKAVSVLNQSINMNLALEGETPYDNKYLASYLQQHMSVMKVTNKLDWDEDKNTGNIAFYTTDGFRFEIPTSTSHINISNGISLYEATSSNTRETWSNLYGTGFNTNKYIKNDSDALFGVYQPGKCGSVGFANLNSTLTGPCLIMVDVNGDRKPNPTAKDDEINGQYEWPEPTDRLLKDVFALLITEEKVVPYGVFAQKAMYQAQK